MSPDHAPDAQTQAALGDARRIMRAARLATLATARDGAPYAALVTPICMPDLTVILLLSLLSEHTAQLSADPRCALLFTDASWPGGGLANPQTIPRITALGTARPTDEPAVRARYLALHPYAAGYAGFSDFRFWRVAITRAHGVAGFARAQWFAADALIPLAAEAACFAAIDGSSLAALNRECHDAICAIGRAATGFAASWRLAAVDPDGFDLISEAGRVWTVWPVRPETGDLAPALRAAARSCAGAERG